VTPKNRAAFTLIEILIVLSILGVLAGLAVPAFKMVHKRSQQKSCYANLRTLNGAVQWYSADNNITYQITAPEHFDPLVEGGFLQARPECPANGAYTCETGLKQCVCATHGTINEEGEEP